MTRDIKMVVTDLDGTYLRSDKSISAYTEQVMAKLRQAGILFVVATARPVRAVRDFLPWVQYDAGIFHNGAVVWNGAERIGGTGIEESQKIVQQITREKAGVHVAIEADDRLYANFDAQRIWPGIQYSSTVNFAELSGKVADKLIIEAHSLEEMAQYRKIHTGAFVSAVIRKRNCYGDEQAGHKDQGDSVIGRAFPYFTGTNRSIRG